jgi:flagellum-specific ATP synthase
MGSISRVSNSLLKKDQIRLGQRLRRLWSLYNEKEDLIQIGAYEGKSNPELDEAIKLRFTLSEFLVQDEHELVRQQLSWHQLGEILA